MSELLNSQCMVDIINRVKAEPVSPELHLNKDFRDQIVDRANQLLNDFIEKDQDAIEVSDDGWFRLVLPVKDSLFPFARDTFMADTIPVVIIDRFEGAADDVLDGAVRITYAYETTYPADTPEENLFEDIQTVLRERDETASPIDAEVAEPEPAKKAYEDKAIILNVKSEDYVGIMFANCDDRGSRIEGFLDTVTAFDVIDDLRQVYEVQQANLRVAA
jgi:hypothetical protein